MREQPAKVAAVSLHFRKEAPHVCRPKFLPANVVKSETVHMAMWWEHRSGSIMQLELQTALVKSLNTLHTSFASGETPSPRHALRDYLNAHSTTLLVFY